MVCSLHMVVQSRWDGVRECTYLLFSGRHMWKHGEISIKEFIGFADGNRETKPVTGWWQSSGVDPVGGQIGIHCINRCLGWLHKLFNLRGCLLIWCLIFYTMTSYLLFGKMITVVSTTRSRNIIELGFESGNIGLLESNPKRDNLVSRSCTLVGKPYRDIFACADDHTCAGSYSTRRKGNEL